MKTLLVFLLLCCPAIASGAHHAHYVAPVYRTPASYGYRAPRVLIVQTQIVTPPPRPGSYLDRQAKAKAAKAADASSSLTTSVNLPPAQRQHIDRQACPGGVCKFMERQWRPNIKIDNPAIENK
jgi:hypothetical protein